MSAIIYENTNTTLPNWRANLHTKYPRGIAYQQGTHFVHIYGYSEKYWTLHPGLTVTQLANGSLNDWAAKTFGATNIKPFKNCIGEVVAGVWRPGLYYQDEVHQALKTDEYEQKSAEQALKILVEKLEQILEYVEPVGSGLLTYGHKIRELLIQACTEVENSWQQYMRLAGKNPKGNYSTEDYFELCAPLFLKEFEISLNAYKHTPAFRPFNGWSQPNTSQSLPWYQGYNKTKHDRNTYFAKATLENCIFAVAANIVMYCVRYSPYRLFDGGGSFSAILSQIFKVRLINPDPATFYLPKMSFPNNLNSHLQCFDAKKNEYMEPWIVKPLIF
jgi:hypothetical protein